MEYNEHNKLRVFTAFSGYDSQCLALERLKRDFPDFDYTLVGWSEIDKYAIKAHDLLFPDAADKNFGDICKIDWGQDVPDFDLFTYSFPCFVAGTKILTDKGYMSIEDVTKDMKVLTHTNSYKPIIRTMQRKYNGAAYSISTPFCHEFICTENHPLYVRRMYRKGHAAIRTFDNAEWKSPREIMKDLTTDRSCRTRRYYMGYAINQKSEIPQWEGVELNYWGHIKPTDTLTSKMTQKSFWYLMGRYVGDGWKRQSESSRGIVICCGGRNEDKLKDAINNLGWNCSIAEERTVRKYHILSKELHSFVERYGYYAHGKFIDDGTLGLPIELLKSFVDGLMDSDGYIDNKGLHKISTVSQTLAYGIGQCVAKVYKRPFSIYKTNRPHSVVIEGRRCNQRDSYTVTWKLSRDKQDKSFYEGGYLWFPINKLEWFNIRTTVYNMEVEDDNSYTANGGIVHNCTDISNAGLQKGFTEDSGTRSSLLWECRKAIEIKRPKYLLMENVKALVQKKFMPEFQRWLSELESFGYVNFWQVLNAKDFGCPQNRERVFCVSILRSDPTPHYEFPKPFKLEKRLRDILETDVDESFYLKQEQVNRIIAHCDRKVAEGCGFKTNFQDGGGISGTIKTKEGSREYDTYIKQSD